jgi:uncharacterized protein (TIGR03000 family)
MYSVVVLMALSTGVDTPDMCFRRGCRGGNGCRGWNGCNGCMGGGWYGGCHGGWGGCYGGYGGGCHGGYVGGGCFGGGYVGGCFGGGAVCGGAVYGGGGGGGYVAPSSPMPMPMPEPKKTDASAPATIVVTLPAEAKLSIDDYATNSTSERRTFVSPALEPGKNYVYTLRAEVTRDSKPVSVTREARVRAGETTTVSIDFPAAPVAAR